MWSRLELLGVSQPSIRNNPIINYLAILVSFQTTSCANWFKTQENTLLHGRSGIFVFLVAVRKLASQLGEPSGLQAKG